MSDGGCLFFGIFYNEAEKKKENCCVCDAGTLFWWTLGTLTRGGCRYWRYCRHCWRRLSSSLTIRSRHSSSIARNTNSRLSYICDDVQLNSVQKSTYIAQRVINVRYEIINSLCRPIVFVNAGNKTLHCHLLFTHSTQEGGGMHVYMKKSSYGRHKLPLLPWFDDSRMRKWVQNLL